MPWIKIFDSIEKAQEAIPNQTSRQVKIGETKVCLINYNDNFYALDDRCPHMGASISDGIVNYLGEGICPLHEYRFNAITGEECENNCDGAKVYLTKMESESFFILI